LRREEIFLGPGLIDVLVVKDAGYGDTAMFPDILRASLMVCG